jgi:perosamine synthetase
LPLEPACLRASPTAETWLPYGRHQVSDEDIAAVVAVLRSDWLTTGPRIEALEAAFAERVGAAECVALSSGTAALHAAMAAFGIGPGDEVIVPSLTFVATANAVVFQGATPVFADVDPATLLLDPRDAEARITARTRAIVAVDYAGQPCDYDELAALARRHDLALVADACHALGATFRGRPVGSLADASAFSLHAVKPIAAGEGGMLATDRADLARRARRFRNHGIETTPRQRQAAGQWRYEMIDLGFNYRLTDFQCALAHSQLGRLDAMLERRWRIAAAYDEALADVPDVRPLAIHPWAWPAWHLYVVRCGGPAARERLYRAFQAARIGAAVHYPPVHLQPYYRRRHGTREGMCPAAEAAAAEVLTLPIHPQMTEADVERVVAVIRQASLAGWSARRAA